MFASVLIKLCIQKFGAECLNFEPDTLTLSLADSKLSDLDFDKINAVSVFLTTEEFQTHWEAFNAICHTLNDIDPNFASLCPLAPQEICWALFELSKTTNDESDFEFSNEVKAYIKKCCEYYGVTFFPTIIKKTIPNLKIKEWNTVENNELDNALTAYVESKWELLKNDLFDSTKTL